MENTSRGNIYPRANTMSVLYPPLRNIRHFEVYVHPRCPYSLEAVQVIRNTPGSSVIVHEVDGTINKEYMEVVRSRVYREYQQCTVRGNDSLEGHQTMPIVVERVVQSQSVPSRLGAGDGGRTTVSDHVRFIGGFSELVDELYPSLEDTIGRVRSQADGLVVASFRSMRCGHCTSDKVNELVFDTIPAVIGHTGAPIHVHHVSPRDDAAWRDYGVGTVPAFLVIRPNGDGHAPSVLERFVGASDDVLDRLRSTVGDYAGRLLDDAGRYRRRYPKKRSGK